jgi:Protein of unknown function (DUF3616)
MAGRMRRKLELHTAQEPGHRNLQKTYRPFLRLPSKENGLDIEGVVVRISWLSGQDLPRALCTTTAVAF